MECFGWLFDLYLIVCVGVREGDSVNGKRLKEYMKANK